MKKSVIYLLSLFLIVLSCSDDKEEPQIVLRYNLTTEVTPDGGGTVSPSTGSFSEGQKVTLTAKPSDGYTFKNWSGAVTGSELTTTVTMSSHKKVTAVFEKNEAKTLIIKDEDWKNNIVSTNETEYTFVFKDNMLELYDLNVGDMIVSTISNGYLRRIKSISTSNNQVTIITDFASISEAFKDLKEEAKQAFIPDYDSPEYWLADGFELSDDQQKIVAGGIRPIKINYVFSDLDNDLSTTNDQVKLTGVYSVSANMNFDIDITNHNFNNLEFGSELNQNLNLKGKIGVGLNEDGEIKFKTIPGHTFIVGGIVLTPVIELYLGAEIHASGSVETEYNNYKTTTTSIMYNGANWTTTKDLIGENQFEKPSFSLDGDVRFYVKPKLSIKVYGTIAPNLASEISARAEAKLEDTNLKWATYLGLNLDLGIEMKIFKKEILDYSVRVYDEEWLIKEGEYDISDTSQSVGIECENLMISNEMYSETDDLDRKIMQEFGDSYSIADWNDLKNMSNLNDWISCMKISHDQAFMVKRDGNNFYGSNRQYYVHYSTDGVPYSGFLVHDRIGDFYLGSWYGLNMNVLTKKSDPNAQTFLEKYDGTKWNEINNQGSRYLRLIDNPNDFMEFWDNFEYSNCYEYERDVFETGTIKFIENSEDRLMIEWSEVSDHLDTIIYTVEDDILKIYIFSTYQGVSEEITEYYNKTSVNVNDLDLCDDDDNGGSISENLVAYYPFNGNSNDESSNGNNGNVNGGAILTTDRFGNAKSAYNFQQSSTTKQYIESNYDFDFNPAGEFSFSFWFNWDGNDFWYTSSIDGKNETTAYAGLLGIGVNESSGSCYNSSATRFYLNVWNTGQIGIQYSPDGCQSLTGQTIKSDEGLFLANSWNHVVVAHDGKGNLNIYLNNNLVASRSDHSLDLTNFSSKVNIGNMHNYFYSGTYQRGNTRNLFSGKIDDVRIYNKNLNASEIKLLFEQ